MKNEIFNYSTQAIEALEKNASNFLPDMPNTAKNILNVARLLRQAVKFILPDNGELFDDGLRALPTVFRLPFPIIAAEFQITTGDLGDGPLVARGEILDRSTKRIALAIEINADNFDQYTWMLSQEKYDSLTEDGGIAIIPIYYVASKNVWAIPPLGLVIPSHKIDPQPNLYANAESMYGENLPAKIKTLPLEVHTTDLMPEQASIIEMEKGLPFVFATAHQDTHDELRAIMSLVEVLACSNVKTENLAAPKLINSKRIGKGKVPFYEYKVLTLDLQQVNQLASNVGGTHASPKIHLRRGHIRRLAQKSIWVNAAVVGNKSQGVVIKNYSIAPASGNKCSGA